MRRKSKKGRRVGVPYWEADEGGVSEFLVFLGGDSGCEDVERLGVICQRERGWYWAGDRDANLEEMDGADMDIACDLGTTSHYTPHPQYKYVGPFVDEKAARQFAEWMGRLRLLEIQRRERLDSLKEKAEDALGQWVDATEGFGGA